jgi:hypothetical protein
MSEDFDYLKQELDNLMEQGALEIVGIDGKTGEFLYSFTEKLIQVNPNIHGLMVNAFHDSIMRLWQEGFFSMDVTAANPLVRATEKVFDQAAISKLSREDQIALSDILRKMSE